MSNCRLLPFEELVRRGNAAHGGRYEYDYDGYTGGRDPLWVFCRVHLQAFIIRPASNLIYRDKGWCPLCWEDKTRTNAAARLAAVEASKAATAAKRAEAARLREDSPQPKMGRFYRYTGRVMPRIAPTPAQSRRANKVTDGFYRSKAWSRLRARVLREQPECSTCGNTADTVDHIKGRRQFPGLALERDNLTALCRSCHSRKTIYSEGVHALPVKACNSLGLPWSPDHPWNQDPKTKRRGLKNER